MNSGFAAGWPQCHPYDDFGQPAAQPEPALTAADKSYLNGLMKEFLFDPREAQRITIKVSVRTVWASAREAAADGWNRTLTWFDQHLK